MELTRTNTVFSRLSMVLFMCRNKSYRNDLKLHGTYFWQILKILAKESRPGGPPPVHEGGGAPAPCLMGPLTLHRPQLQLHIFVFGEKNQREGFIAFYDTEVPPPPVPHLEGRSGVRSGLRRGEIVAIVIINLPPSTIP